MKVYKISDAMKIKIFNSAPPGALWLTVSSDGKYFYGICAEDAKVATAKLRNATFIKLDQITLSPFWNEVSRVIREGILDLSSFEVEIPDETSTWECSSPACKGRLVDAGKKCYWCGAENIR